MKDLPRIFLTSPRKLYKPEEFESSKNQHTKKFFKSKVLCYPTCFRSIQTQQTAWGRKTGENRTYLPSKITERSFTCFRKFSAAKVFQHSNLPPWLAFSTQISSTGPKLTENRAPYLANTVGKWQNVLVFTLFSINCRQRKHLGYLKKVQSVHHNFLVLLRESQVELTKRWNGTGRQIWITQEKLWQSQKWDARIWRNRVSRPSSGPEFCVIWLLKMPASGWGLLWASLSFVPWLALNTFLDVSGAVPV